MSEDNDAEFTGPLVQRLTAIEYNLKRLLGRAGLDWEEPPSRDFPADVVLAMTRGDKITAIKLLKERLNLTLAQAKEAVDRGAP